MSSNLIVNNIEVGAGATIYTAASNQLTFGTQGGERVRINATGYVGINDSSGNARLIVKGTSDTSDADCQIRIYDTDGTAGSQVPSVSFWGGSTEIGRIRGTDTSGMRFYTANSGTLVEKFKIHSDGVIQLTSNTSAQNTTKELRFSPTTSTNRYASIQAVNNSGNNHIDLRFFTADANTPVERFRITSGGTVNIGGDYANTTGKLKVTGVVTVDGGFSLTAGTFTAPSGFSIASGNVTIPGDIFHDGDSNTYFGFSGADTFRVVTGGTERLKIDANGAVQLTRRLELTNSGDITLSMKEERGLGQILV